MRNTSSIGGLISSDWAISTSLLVQVRVPPPSLWPDLQFRQFDSAGVFTLIELGIDEDTDDILSAEETMLLMKSSPQDIIRYREYREKRGL